MTKLFAIAGVSSVNGVAKYRVANGTIANRTKLLERAGQTDIKMIELPNTMTKEDAFAFIASHADFQAVKPSVKGGVSPKAKTETAAVKAA